MVVRCCVCRLVGLARLPVRCRRILCRFRFLSVILIFNFVAVWHDLDMRLMYWAWGICALFIVEMLLMLAFSGPRCWGLRSRWFFRPMCTVAGVFNVWLNIAANLVGFCFGIDGLSTVVEAFLRTLSPWFLVGFFVVYYCTVNVMMYLRYGRSENGAANW